MIPPLADTPLPLGKRVHLHRLLFEAGPGNGKLLVLPIDQGFEHGPRDFFDNPESVDPAYQARLAVAGNFSAIAWHMGLAAKYGHLVAGRVPMLIKLNGKTEIPPDDQALSPLLTSVEEAVAVGADAVGYTLYVGSPAQDRDLAELGRVRRAADRFGLPLVVWSYPRGSAVEAKGGRDSVYAVAYAARVACEMGADVVKLNYPGLGAGAGVPRPYGDKTWTHETAMAHIVASAGRTPILLSGGTRKGDEGLLEMARVALAAGVTGFIFGRNVWQRPWDQGLALVAQLTAMLTA